MVKAKSWRKRSFFNILNHITCRMRLLFNLGANCLLPLQQENSGVRNFQLAVVCKRAVSPQIGHQPRNSQMYTKLTNLIEVLQVLLLWISSIRSSAIGGVPR